MQHERQRLQAQLFAGIGEGSGGVPQMEASYPAKPRQGYGFRL
jgi:hypothetical protein